MRLGISSMICVRYGRSANLNWLKVRRFWCLQLKSHSLCPIYLQRDLLPSTPLVWWLQDRVRYEADALRQQHSLCPEHVPAVYHFDAQNALIVMQYLPPPHVILRKSIVQVTCTHRHGPDYRSMQRLHVGRLGVHMLTAMGSHI